MWRDPAFPFVAPMISFLLGMTILTLGPLERWLPVHVAYPLRALISTAVIVAVWKRLPKFRLTAPWAALGVGALVAVLWVVADPWFPWLDMGGWKFTFERPKGYNPFAPVEQLTEPLAWAFCVVRILAGAVVVGICEELFWRGWLMRYLIKPDFEQVPMGTFEWRSFAITTVAFAAVHPQLLLAIPVGVIYGLFFVWRRNVWDVVLAHAFTNFVLYSWVVWAGRVKGMPVWYFWP
jgi:hypothetical protein